MFVPKVYIVLFQPHKNVRQGATKIKGLAAGARSIFGHPNTGLNSLDVACPSESIDYFVYKQFPHLPVSCVDIAARMKTTDTDIDCKSC